MDEIKSKARIENVLPKYGVTSFKIMGGETVYKCPFHEDKKPSLRINIDKQLWHCDPCKAIGNSPSGGDIYSLVQAFEKCGFGQAKDKVKEMFGLSEGKKEKVAEYIYTDVFGEPVYKVEKYVNGSSKSFAQFKKTETGYEAGMSDVQRVLYNLPEVNKSREVWITEGEKDAITLNNAGVVATTNVGGAGKWMDGYTDILKGKNIVLCLDNDKAGEGHRELLLKSLAGQVESVRVIKLDAKDISAYLNGKDDHNSLIQDLYSSAQVLHKGLDIPIYSMAQMKQEYIEHISHAKENCVDLGKFLPEFKRYIRPVDPGELILLMARTGVGKTAVCQNIAKSMNNMKVLFFELELPTSLMYERFAAMCTGTSSEEIANQADEDIHVDFSDADHVFVCPETGIGIDKLREYVIKSELVIGEKPGLVIVDYVGLMEGFGKRYEWVTDLAQGMKKLAKELNVVFCLVTQTRRPPPQKNKSFKEDLEESGRVGIHDGKDSGALEESAGLALGIWRPSEVEIEFDILKCTKGGAGNSVLAIFEGDKMIIRSD